MELSDDLKKNIDLIHERFEEQKLLAYGILCEIDILSDSANMALRTKLYESTCKILLKPERNLIERKAFEVKTYCTFAATEAEGVQFLPPRNDERYQIISDTLYPIIEETHRFIDDAAGKFSNLASNEMLGAIANLLDIKLSSDRDAESDGVKTQLNICKTRCAEKCVKTLNEYDILMSNKNGSDKKSIYRFLAIGLAGVGMPISMFKNDRYLSIEGMEKFVHDGFEIVGEEFNYSLPDRENEKYKAMIAALWSNTVELIESISEIEKENA